jgi:hypothetical protein
MASAPAAATARAAIRQEHRCIVDIHAGKTRIVPACRGAGKVWPAVAGTLAEVIKAADYD